MVRTQSTGSDPRSVMYSPSAGLDASTMPPLSPLNLSGSPQVQQSPIGAQQSKPTLDDVKHLVQPACASPKQKRISDNFRSSVTRNQIEIFFEPQSDDRKELHEDLDVLRKAADDEGWIPLSTLMSLKNMYYPGHDLMREAIQVSDKLQLDQADDMFRCKDEKTRKAWLAVSPRRQPSK